MNTIRLVLLFLLAAVTAPRLPSVVVAWDPNLETNIGGYNCYYGIVGSGMTNVLSARMNTQQTVAGLQPRTEYWFYVTAYNVYGLESDPSSILFYTTPAIAPLNPQRVRLDDKKNEP